MNKKLITALIAITLAVPTTAHAAGIQNRTGSTPAVAILDTAIDTSLPAFQGKIIQEVCILEWTTCPNGKSFMLLNIPFYYVCVLEKVLDRYVDYIINL